jgi:hypothetical protein
MNNITRKTVSVFLGLLCSTAGIAQSGGTFTITKSVIADGGGRATGGTFTVDGTIGQSVAGGPSTGGTFSLASGFWGGGELLSRHRMHHSISTAMERPISVSSDRCPPPNGGSIEAQQA